MAEEEQRSTTEINAKFDGTTSRLSVWLGNSENPIYSRYLLEGEGPGEALEQASEVVRRILVRKWNMKIRGELV